MKSIEQKRKEANHRLTERSKRSTAQQLALIAQRPGNSKLEVARLKATK